MGRMMRGLPASAAAVAVMIVSAQTANATNGMFPHCVGVYSCGMGGAGMAMANDASNMAINPASIGKLGNELSVSVGWFTPKRTMDLSATNPAGGANTGAGKQTSQIEDYPDGALAGSLRLNPQWAIGVALFPGGGGETKYVQGRTFTGNAGTYDRSVRIRMGNLAPTIAYSPDANSSYGFSLILGYQDFKTDFATLPALAQTAGRNSMDSAYGWGVRVGGMWDFNEFISAGASVQSPIWYQRLDKYKDVFIGAMDMPMQVGAGFAIHPTKQWDLLADLKVIDWEGVTAIGGEQPAQGGFGWENQTVLAIGAQYHMTDSFTLRGGWNYGKSPIPDNNVFANALFPAIIEHHVTAGATYRLTPNWELSAAGFYAPKVELTDNGTGDMFSQMGAGTTISHYQYGAQVGLRWKF